MAEDSLRIGGLLGQHRRSNFGDSGEMRVSKGQAGRIAGHHLTPGQGWRWQKFGDAMMLVTDGGGADVVLSCRHKGGGRAELITCDPAGHMVALSPEGPLGALLAALPELAEVALDICARDDRPSYRPRLEAALRKAGLL